MGMDGLSIANTGIVKESTSADFTNRTEQIIQTDPTNDMKQVQTLSTNRRVREKDEEEENQKNQQQTPQEEEFEDGFVKSEDEFFKEEEFDIEDLENPNKDFYVKLNSKDDIIELYDSATNRLVETISGNELSELVKKLNMASGIFVNKKV
ncbi:MAG: hypothetical protein NC408_05195 [Candidatus Gastranaerophilales bacterium]|nr:hypothetical protein [Candidatus Gastranaerophilales bacterium]MCM1073663.1 hypothetical protein [Bacteroides sp.]